MGKLGYLTSCVQLTRDDVDDLRTMTDQAREITLATFRRRCDTAEWERSLGYERGAPKGGRRGLSLTNDWHVGFYVSRFRGRRVYFAKHSAIEHIFGEA